MIPSRKRFLGPCLIFFTVALVFIGVTAEASVRVRIRTQAGVVLEGRVYDLGNEYLEVGSRLGNTRILKREVKGWSLVDTESEESPGILLIMKNAHEISGNVRFDAGTREWVVDLELGSARYPDSQVERTILPNGICSDDRYAIRADFHERITRALDGVRSDDAMAKKEGSEFIRAAGFFAWRYLEEALAAGENIEFRKILLEERFRMALPVGLTDSHPHFLKNLTEGNSKTQIELLRGALLENGSDLYPLLGLLLLDEAQSADVRSFSVDVLQRTHSVKELLSAWQSSTAHAQMALAIALGENGVYIGISTLINALELEEVAARSIAADKLMEYTGQLLGFEPDGDPVARAESVKLWRQWWTENQKRIEKIAVSVLEGKELSAERRRASDLWRQGIEAESESRFDAAERFYRKAIEVDPTAMGPFVSLGIFLYQNRSDYDGALESFRKALGREPGIGDGINERTCYYHIGRINQLGLDFDRARTALLKAIQADPNYSAAWFELGRILSEEALLNSGDLEQRKIQLKEALETFENGIVALIRYREGLIVVDRTNLPFDSALPFSTRDHNRSLRDLRMRILEELGRFRGRISALSLVLGDPSRVLKEFQLARTEGSVSDELKRLVVVARGILQEGDPEPAEQSLPEDQ
ncbi:MAG: tetratricopeptide repeat protein [Planctomycetota bacterium]